MGLNFTPAADPWQAARRPPAGARSCSTNQEMPPRVRAAVGGGALDREARLLCGHADRHDRRDELDLGRAGSARVAALVGEQTRWHDAGW
eukprot:6336832-Prymnesium_polylepis.1